MRKGWKEVHTAAGRRVQVEFINIQHLLFPLPSKCYNTIYASIPVLPFTVLTIEIWVFAFQEDRGKWLRNKEERKKAEIHMEEDTLLVVI